MGTTQGPLNILIAGAGIGGLATALALRQAGHNVQVFERSNFNSEYGAAVSIGPNANGPLRNMGVRLEDFGAVNTELISEFLGEGKLVRSTDTSKSEEDFNHPWQFVHRVDLHRALKEHATAASGKGKPVAVKLGSKAVSVDPETATITLEDGTTHHGDVVIGADGVHSSLRKFVDPDIISPVPFGLVSFRFLIPTSVLSADPQTKRFVKNPGEFQFWGIQHRRLVVYSCRDGELLNCAVIVKGDISEGKQDWTKDALRAYMIDQFHDFHPDALVLISKADEIGYWPLFDLPALNNWVNGRVALIGDAAHPFLPFQGQGAAQAIEDAVTLAEMLPVNMTSPADVPGRLRLYHLARCERVGQIQQVSRQLGKGPDADVKTKSPLVDQIDYNFAHDARRYAAEFLKQSLVKERNCTASL